MQCSRPRFDSCVGKIPWRRHRLPTPVFLGFLCGSAGKESVCNVEDLGLIPGLGRGPGEGKSYPLYYSGLENSMNCMVHGAGKSQTRLSDFHFQGIRGFPGGASDKEPACQGRRCKRCWFGHDWSDLACTHARNVVWKLWEFTM